MKTKEVLELGRELVKEMGLDEGVDTLSKWIIHHIAELINEVENTKGKDKEAKLLVCTQAIVELWKHRQYMPHEIRPLVELDPILNVISSLDISEEENRYYRYIRDEIDVQDDDSEVKKWIGASKNIDITARLLVKYCLTMAAQNAIDKSKNWVKLALDSGLDQGPDFSALGLLNFEAELLTPSEEEKDESEREVLKGRIKQLELFMEAASSIIAEMKGLLK